MIARQEALLNPVLAWARGALCADMSPSTAMLPPAQPPGVRAAYADFLGALPYGGVVAMGELTGALKSLLLGFALFAGPLTLEEV